MELCKWCGDMIAPGEEHKCDKIPPPKERYVVKQPKESRSDRLSRVAFTAHMAIVAKYHSMKHGSVTIDDLRAHAIKHGITSQPPDVWASIFSGKQWEAVSDDSWRFTAPQQLK